MPVDYSLYHPKWPLISYLIRVVRAKNRCEQCGVKNGVIIRRLNGARYKPATGCDLIWIHYLRTFRYPNGRRFTLWQALQSTGLTRVILTVAHLDRNRDNNRFGNLKALCQRCHLLYDKPQHNRSRAYGRDYDQKPQLTIPF